MVYYSPRSWQATSQTGIACIVCDPTCGSGTSSKVTSTVHRRPGVVSQRAWGSGGPSIRGMVMLLLLLSTCTQRGMPCAAQAGVPGVGPSIMLGCAALL